MWTQAGTRQKRWIEGEGTHAKRAPGFYFYGLACACGESGGRGGGAEGGGAQCVCRRNRAENLTTGRSMSWGAGRSAKNFTPTTRPGVPLRVLPFCTPLRSPLRSPAAHMCSSPALQGACGVISRCDLRVVRRPGGGRVAVAGTCMQNARRESGKVGEGGAETRKGGPPGPFSWGWRGYPASPRTPAWRAVEGTLGQSSEGRLLCPRPP